MSSRVWAVVAVATVAGAAAGAQPAGWRPADVVLSGALAGLVTLAGSRSARWTWFVIAGVAAVAPSTALPTACAVAALLIALASVFFDSRSPVVGAGVAGLAVQALLRLRGFGFQGAPSIVAGLAMLPVLVSAYRTAPWRAQRAVRVAVLASGVFVIVCIGLVAVAGLQARNRIERAVREAQAGFDSAQNGDRDGAVANLSAADSSFGSVADVVGAWWARPARVVPFLGQQMEAVQTMADEGHALSHTASTGLATIDYDRLRVLGGAIDLTVLRSAQQPLGDAVAALDHASDHLGAIGSDWLVPPIRDRYNKFEKQIARALPAATNAREVVALGPQLLGGDRPMHYIVLFGTPAESRELGGLIGNFAEVTADKGKLTLTRSGRHTDIDDVHKDQPYSLQPGPYLQPFEPYHVTTFFGNISASPSLDEVANVTQQIYPQAFGDQVDGVFYMDPYSLAALLDLTGPIMLPDGGVTLNATNAARTLLVDQYQTFEERPARVDFLDEATRITFEKLTSGDLPKPARVAKVMNPTVEQGSMLAFSPDPAVESLFRRLGMDGAFPVPHGGDFLSVRESNNGANKIDAYMQRSITYDASYRPDTGAIDSTLTVKLTNSAPAGGLPDIVLANPDGRPRGTNEMILTVYSPLSVTTATADGNQQRFGGSNRYGLNAYAVPVVVPPGATVTIQLKMQGSVAPSRDYRLTVARQAIVNPDQIDVKVAGASGWTVSTSDQLAVDGGVAQGAVDESRISSLTAHLTQ